jgi:hypothetical protein
VRVSSSSPLAYWWSQVRRYTHVHWLSLTAVRSAARLGRPHIPSPPTYPRVRSLAPASPRRRALGAPARSPHGLLTRAHAAPPVPLPIRALIVTTTATARSLLRLSRAAMGLRAPAPPTSLAARSLAHSPLARPPAFITRRARLQPSATAHTAPV